MQKKKSKKQLAWLLAVTMLLSGLPAQQTQAAGYGLNNPTTDSNGVTTWDCVYFGNYWQNDTNGDGVADENDEKQPIKWRVLSVDGDDAFLLADQNLDVKAYLASYYSSASYINTTWETCTLRSWLNGYSADSNQESQDYSDNNFIDAAFTLTEQNVITQTTVINEDNSKYGTKGGNDTNDKVYLLSVAEVSNASYGFNSTYEINSDTRESTNTAYVEEKSGKKDAGETGVWWLRSPGGHVGTASSIYRNGYGYYSFSNVRHSSAAVRPALHLNLSSSNLWSYAGTVSSEVGSQSAATPVPTESASKKPGSTQDYGLSNPITDENNATTWDCVYFGNYWQNDTNGDGVADENDEKQPIKWRVLSVDGEDAFLMADENLDTQDYNQSTVALETWETCTLRSWLNGYGKDSNIDSIDYSNDNFIDSAFTSEEKNAIKQTMVVNEDNQYGTEGGNDTMDQIYLLSIGEASDNAYGFNSEFSVKSETRAARNTAYAIQKGAYTSEANRRYGGNGNWWLRSPGTDSTCGTDISAWIVSASKVDYNGYGNAYSSSSGRTTAVRPVLHLNLSQKGWSYAEPVSVKGVQPDRRHTWKCIYFGNYWQEDTNEDGTVDEKDEKQPIKWRILSEDGDDAFLVADRNLDAKPYNETIEDDVTWETCTLRSWLNGYGASSNVKNIDYTNDNFINNAFTSEERDAIHQTTVVNEDNWEYGTDGGNDTQDQIYLLSIAEASNAEYGFNSTFDTESKTRTATDTAYVTDRKEMSWSHNEDNYWWLRSLGAWGNASTIDCDGLGNYSGSYVADGEIAVRPALHLDLSSNLWTDAGTVSSESEPEVTPDPTDEPSIQPTVSPSMTPVPTSSAAQDTKGTPTPTASSGMTPAPSTTPSNTKATLSPAAVGTTVKDKTVSYKVISADKKQPAVAYTKVLKKNACSVTVPDKIKVNGVTYQVKSIAPKAFANNKKLKKITIGKNVTSIGKQAFAGCKKLKKITIKSAKLKSSSIGKNAFKGTAKKLTVKVPKKKYKAYKNFLKKKGNKTVKVTK